MSSNLKVTRSELERQIEELKRHIDEIELERDLLDDHAAQMQEAIDNLQAEGREVK